MRTLSGCEEKMVRASGGVILFAIEDVPNTVSEGIISRDLESEYLVR
jgi:hypothetical protein